MVREKTKKLRRLKKTDIIIYIFFAVLALLTLYPFYYVLIMSVANASATAKYVPYLYPHVLDMTGYKTVFQDGAFYKALGISLFVTIAGTALNMILSVMGAYVLAKRELPGRKIFLYIIIFTLLFSGGLVPGYLNVKNLGLTNTIWSMILPTAISTYYLIIMKNYFLSFPASLEEAAKLDGAGAFTILIRIVIPTSMPFMATFTLFYAVERWNEWYNAMLYINKKDLQPLQIYLRELLMNMSNQLSVQAQTMMGMSQKVLTSTIQMACIVVTMIPILCVYPFVQKHFVKGIMIGGVKG